MPEPVTAGAERRRDPRFALLRRLELRDGGGIAVLGQVVDVSAEGLRIVGPRPLALDTEFEATMQLDGPGDPTRLLLRAVWSETGPGPAGCRTGCRLIEPLDRREAIEDLVQRLRRFLADQLP